MTDQLKVSKLFIYPVKSLAGVTLDNAEVTERGFHLDRRWMLVNKKGVFMTQRKYPVMSLLKVKPDHKGLTIFHKDEPANTLFVPYDIALTESVKVKVWSDRCYARELSLEANQWFSEVLGTECKLVYMHDDSKRMVDTRYSPIKNNVSFADGFQFLLTNDKSMDDLNERMGKEFSIKRFRPNIVVNGTEPYEEDSWKKIRIGDVVFHVVKPCSRCSIPTIDPETGQMSKEPLKTLSTYRKRNFKIMFGQNMVPENIGEINVNDEVEVLEKRQ